MDNVWMIGVGMIVGIILWECVVRNVESRFKIILKERKPRDERTTK